MRVKIHDFNTSMSNISNDVFMHKAIYLPVNIFSFVSFLKRPIFGDDFVQNY